MPNWCLNKLSIQGRRDDIREFAGMLDGMKDDDGFFNTFHPMPPELRGTVSPVMLVSEEERQEYLSGKRETFGGMPITHRMQRDFLQRFGADNWYDWACAKWGTKWDVRKKDLYRADWKQGTGITLTFDTAWGPPLEAMVALAKKFPKLKFTISYNEPGMCFSGKEIYGPHG